MKIRLLKQSDAEEASKLYREAIRQLGQYYTAKELKEEDRTYSVRNLKSRIQEKKFHFRAAEENNKIIGIIEYCLPVPRLCWIQWVIVKKAYRRKSIGSALSRTLEERSTSKEYDKIQTRSRIGNSASVNLLKKLGYKKIATLRRRLPKRSVYTWEKVL